MQAIERLLQQAVTYHRAGDLAAAEECCRRVLQVDPRHPKANHNLGALCVQQGRIADALPFLIAALEADPAHGQYWLSYVDALRQAGRLDEARAELGRVLAILPKLTIASYREFAHFAAPEVLELSVAGLRRKAALQEVDRVLRARARQREVARCLVPD